MPEQQATSVQEIVHMVCERCSGDGDLPTDDSLQHFIPCSECDGSGARWPWALRECSHSLPGGIRCLCKPEATCPLDGKHHCHECHGTSYVSAIDDVGVLMAKAGGIWTVDATNPPLIRVIWWGKVGESVDMKEAAAAAFLAAQS